MLTELRSTPFTVVKKRTAASVAHTGKLRHNRSLKHIAKEEVGRIHVLRMVVFAQLVDTLTSDDMDVVGNGGDKQES